MRQEFAYHRSLGPMIGVLLGIAIVEMCVVHLVVGTLFGWAVALGVGVLDLSLVLGLILVLRSLRRLPVTLTGGVLTMRAGVLKSVTVPTRQIAGLRATWDAAALKESGVLNLALASWPSVVVDLHPPVLTRRGKPIHAIAHKLDDPAAFHAAIAALSRDHGH
ncbi:hypothetical protein [Sphingomonas echinoides]|uniref:PH domain-containing protein n=1 Tax=Sphingomonas echinoides TaxID=59803 RepID=A0ABU4PLF2_9SPHN|nr:hypothetical protein [Sphingomonas echinoides]MDX5985010.1 hypothetical protein [Sphingomonas echinoides]